MAGANVQTTSNKEVNDSFGYQYNQVLRSRGNCNLSFENTMDKENVYAHPENRWAVDCNKGCTLRSKTNLNLNVKQIKTEANKTIQSVKVTFDTLSQKLRRSTRRRNRLEAAETPKKDRQNCRTPVKMYSPFKIDTPCKISTRFSKNELTPKRHSPRSRFQSFDSPSQTFRRDVEALTRGTRQLSAMAKGISNTSSFNSKLI